MKINKRNWGKLKEQTRSNKYQFTKEIRPIDIFVEQENQQYNQYSIHDFLPDKLKIYGKNKKNLAMLST